MGTLQCGIHRDKRSFSKKFYPRYNLFIDSKFVMASQKMSLVGSAHYLFTLDMNEEHRNQPGYLGKLRSNKSCTEYNLFGIGENPDKNFPPEQTRNEDCAIVYVNLLKNQ